MGQVAAPLKLKTLNDRPYIEDNFGKDVIETDGAFGAAGAITGSIIPGAGTVAGAVGTGGTASIAECIRQLLK